MNTGSDWSVHESRFPLYGRNHHTDGWWSEQGWDGVKPKMLKFCPFQQRPGCCSYDGQCPEMPSREPISYTHPLHTPLVTAGLESKGIRVSKYQGPSGDTNRTLRHCRHGTFLLPVCHYQSAVITNRPGYRRWQLPGNRNRLCEKNCHFSACVYMCGQTPAFARNHGISHDMVLTFSVNVLSMSPHKYAYVCLCLYVCACMHKVGYILCNSLHLCQHVCNCVYLCMYVCILG